MKQGQSGRRVRHKRVRGKISGTAAIPRLSVFRSNRHINAQLIDDELGRTLAHADDIQRKADAKGAVPSKNKPNERAQKIGELLAKRASIKKIFAAVFDRGGYKYHGVVKAVAEGARKGGLKF